jgi:hypothetical protein
MTTLPSSSSAAVVEVDDNGVIIVNHNHNHSNNDGVTSFSHFRWLMAHRLEVFLAGMRFLVFLGLQMSFAHLGGVEPPTIAERPLLTSLALTSYCWLVIGGMWFAGALLCACYAWALDWVRACRGVRPHPHHPHHSLHHHHHTHRPTSSSSYCSGGATTTTNHNNNNSNSHATTTTTTTTTTNGGSSSSGGDAAGTAALLVEEEAGRSVVVGGAAGLAEEADARCCCNLWAHLRARLSPGSHRSACSAGLWEDLLRCSASSSPAHHHHFYHHHHRSSRTPPAPWERGVVMMAGLPPLFAATAQQQQRRPHVPPAASALLSVDGFGAFPLAPHACMYLYGLVFYVLGYSVCGFFWLPQYSIIAGALLALAAAPSSSSFPAMPAGHGDDDGRMRSDDDDHDYYYDYDYDYDDDEDDGPNPGWLQEDDSAAAEAPPPPNHAAQQRSRRKPLGPPPPSSRRGSLARGVGLFTLCLSFGLLLVERLLLPADPYYYAGGYVVSASAEALRNLWMGVALPCAVGLSLRGWCHHHHRHSSAPLIRAQSLLSFAVPALLVFAVTFLSLYLPTQQCAQQLLVQSTSLLAATTTDHNNDDDSAAVAAQQQAVLVAIKQNDTTITDEAGLAQAMALFLNASRAYYSLLGPPSESIGIGTIVIPDSASGLLAVCTAPTLLWVALTVIVGCGLRTPSLAASTTGAYLLSVLYHRLLLLPPATTDTAASSASRLALMCAFGLSHLAGGCLLCADIAALDDDAAADGPPQPPPLLRRLARRRRAQEEHDVDNAELGP